MTLDLRAYTAVSTARSIALIATEFALIAAAIGFATWPASGWMGYVLAVVVIGSRMRALNNLCHDGSHHMLSSHRRINALLMALVSYPILISPRAYLASHRLHHGELGHDTDPDWMRYRELGLDRLPRALSRRAVAWRLLRAYRTYVLGAQWSGLWFHRTRDLGLLIAWLIAALLVVWTGTELGWFWYWAVPYLTVFQLVRFIGELSEHGGLYQRVPLDTALATRAVAVSRNIVLHPLLNALIYPHGGGLHVLHHRYPGIPGPALGRLHRALELTDGYRNLGAVQTTRRLLFSRPGSVSLWDALVLPATRD